MSKTIIINTAYGRMYLNINTQGAGSIKTNFCCDESSAINMFESVVLAHACAGVDVESKEYVDGLNTAMDAWINNL